MKIAVGNVGSTSFKSKIFEFGDDGQVAILGQADLDRITTAGESTFKYGTTGELTKELVDIKGFDSAIDLVLGWYVQSEVISDVSEIQAVGFKTVLAGLGRGACVLTEDVLK